MLQSTLVSLSLPEANLVDTIQFVQFGELFGVEIPSEENTLERQVSPAMLELILYIRTGCQYIDVLSIHNGQPTFAETDFKKNGFRCRRKVKFPTG